MTQRYNHNTNRDWVSIAIRIYMLTRFFSFLVKTLGPLALVVMVFYAPEFMIENIENLSEITIDLAKEAIKVILHH